MYIVQEKPDEKFKAVGSEGIIEPLVTLKDPHGGCYHIIKDDPCYILLNASSVLSGHVEYATHWFLKATNTLREYLNSKKKDYQTGQEPKQPSSTGKKMISIEKNFLEHLLNCLANQKFINETPPNGDALAMGKKAYEKVQVDNQAIIDKAWKDGMSMLSKGEDAVDQ